MTDRVSSLAVVLLRNPTARHYGVDLVRACRSKPSVLYPVLTHLIGRGWLVDGRESEEEAANPDFPRRYYLLTAEGRAMMSGLRLGAMHDPEPLPPGHRYYLNRSY